MFTAQFSVKGQGRRAHGGASVGDPWPRARCLGGGVASAPRDCLVSAGDMQWGHTKPSGTSEAQACLSASCGPAPAKSRRHPHCP